MPTVRDNIDPFDDNRLVVNLPDAALVARELTGIGIQPEPGTSVVELGLTAYTLHGLGPAAAALRAAEPDLVAQAKLDRPWAPTNAKTQDGDITDLDLVLFRLRQQFRDTYNGWTPLMGKDRLLRGIHGLPYIKGGEGDPEPLPAPLAVQGGGTVGGPRVGIVDTRIFPHPVLAGRYLGDPATDLGSPPLSTAGHATFIAGLILRRAPEAELVVRAVLDDDGTATSSMAVAATMASFLGTGVEVLNLSWGCFTRDMRPPLVLQRAVERLSTAMVLVAAAGNYGRTDRDGPAEVTARSPMWPAALPGVVAVGADDDTGAALDFSPDVPWVDLMAPGSKVASIFLPGVVSIVYLDSSGQLVIPEDKPQPDFGQGYATWSGTSFAAANVTGEIAARMRRDGIGAREALDQLLHPSVGAHGDIRPHPLQ